MAIERKWEAVSQTFTGNGTQDGVIPVADASGFFAKQRAKLTSNTQPPLLVEVRRVTATTIQVGLPGSQFTTYTDVTAYTAADSAVIRADEQEKPLLKPDEIWQAIYQRDPAVALRELLVNKFGVPIDTVVGTDGRTRLAVDADVTVTGISVDLDALTPPTRPDPDNVLIAGSEDGTKTGLKHAARIDSELDLRVGISDGANKAEVNADGELSVHDADVLTALQNVTNVDDEFQVHDADVLAELTAILAALNASLKSLAIGTEDGTVTGVQRVFVNNFRQQILATQDRQQELTWADINNKKNRRLIQADYTSATIPGITARKTFIYTLAGGDYVVTDINWSLV